MLVYILDEQLRKIDLLKKYTFVQYTDKVRKVGTFKINARIVKDNLYLLDKKRQFFVLFDHRLIGEVKKVTRDSDSEYEKVITIEGKLSLVLFENRVINGTLKFKGYTFEYVGQLVKSYITADKESNRYISIDVNLGNEKEQEELKSICNIVDKQVTGGYLWDEMENALEQDGLCISFTPKGTELVASSDVGVEEWSLRVTRGVDRTKWNKEGNPPVVFSQSLSNIERTSYIVNSEDYKNVAYIAGEGEEEDRKWYEVYAPDQVQTYAESESQNKKGWLRKELWIDARDVQSEDEEGNALSESEYEEAIKQRANEKFAENQLSETYEATITEANKQYTYGVDYNKGDWVTVVDNELGIEVDVQITEVTKSVEGVREIVDLGFTYGKIERDLAEETKNNSVKLEQIETNIKYIDNKVRKIFNAQELLWSGALYMNENQKITLPKSWLDFPNGIELVWSSYENNQAQEYQWNTFFLPKKVLDSHRGGYSFWLVGAGNWLAWKYLYFEDDNVTISGNENNSTDNTTGSGITFHNNHFVLREVWGV